MKNKDFSYYLSRFLKEYLIIERNMSSNTIRSYTKTFQILLDYLVNQKSIKLANINFETITKEIILDFLKYLEEEKQNSITTRNLKLAAIKSFYQYCLLDEVQNIDNVRKVLSIKMKKYEKKVQDYLTEEEVKNILENINTSAKVGRRNLLLLALLYDTAGRADEIIKLKVEDIRLEENLIILTGKGKKQRVVPIMKNTKDLLIQYLKENKKHAGYLFGEKITYSLLHHLFLKINETIPDKKITPHTFRRTRATHLLEKGVNILYIQEFLGNEDISTTQTYAKVIEKSKFEAITKATPQAENDKLTDWNDDQDLLNQLLNI